MTRTSCLGTANCIIVYIYLRGKEILLIFFCHFVVALLKSLHDQPLLDYFWDISTDWQTAKNDNSAWKIDWYQCMGL